MLERFVQHYHPSHPEKALELQDLVDGLDKARKELNRLASLTTALPADISDIHDLPQELLDELSVLKADTLEDQIVTVLNAYGGTADLDRVLIGLFRKFGVQQKRRFMQNKMYRMKESGVIWTVPGKKGVYSTAEVVSDPVADKDAENAFEGFEYKSPDVEDTDEIPF